METYDGYFENGRFVPLGKARIPEHRKVKVTVYNEVVPDKKARRLAELDKIWGMIEAAKGEEMPPLERMSFTRGVEL